MVREQWHDYLIGEKLTLEVADTAIAQNQHELAVNPIQIKSKKYTFISYDRLNRHVGLWCMRYIEKSAYLI